MPKDFNGGRHGQMGHTKEGRQIPGVLRVVITPSSSMFASSSESDSSGGTGISSRDMVISPDVGSEWKMMPGGRGGNANAEIGCV